MKKRLEPSETIHSDESAPIAVQAVSGHGPARPGLFARRMLAFAAAVILAAVLVGAPVYHFSAVLAGRGETERALAAQGQTLAALSDQGAAALDGGAQLLAAEGGKVWIMDSSGQSNVLAGDIAIPADIMERFSADENARVTCDIGGVRMRARALELGDAGRMVLALPLKRSGELWPSLVGLLAGFAAACAVGWPLSRRLSAKPMAQLTALRDVAVAVGGGDFDARADEEAPDEMGEVGRALNDLSHQLSRNMYTLIVERNRLKHMLNGLSEGIIAIDSDGQVTHINPAIAGMFEQQRVSVGLPDPRMKFVPEQEVWEDFDRVIKTGETATRNLSSRDMTIRLTITSIVDEIGAIAGAVGLFSDITQSERLERTRREYVSNVSHELRTPLTSVRALVEPLKEGMVTAEADRQRYYDIILREVMRLSRLINDQLELSRLQSGNVAISKQNMTIDDLVYDVCDRYAAIAREHGLELKLESDFSQCPMVYANADRVEQMLIILLDNAIKYTEHGSVAISAQWDAEKITLTVRDTGIGIDEKDLPYVFDRFYKVDKAHSGKGSGLGLSIARELLARMGEEIWVKSRKGEGSAFSFTIHRPTETAEAE